MISFPPPSTASHSPRARASPAVSPSTGNKTLLSPGHRTGGLRASRNSCRRCHLAVGVGRSWTFKVSSETNAGNLNLFAVLIP